MSWDFEKNCNIFGNLEKFWRGHWIFKQICKTFSANFVELKILAAMLGKVRKNFHETWKYFEMHLE